MVAQAIADLQGMTHFDSLGMLRGMDALAESHDALDSEEEGSAASMSLASDLQDFEPHREHGEPDQAIGQLRGDAPPVEALDEDSWDFGTVTRPPGKEVSYSYTEELINFDLAVRLSQTEVMKSTKYNSLSWAEILLIFARRARDITAQGVGLITSAWWESKREVKWPGRRYSGISGQKPSHLPEEERSSPGGFAGLSPFGLPRTLRAILRCGVGLTDIDMEISHVQLQLMLGPMLKLEMPVTSTIWENRAAVLEDIVRSEWGRNKTVKHAKRLLVMIIYGMQLPRGLPPIMQEFELEQHRFTASVLNAYPREAKLVRKPATLVFYLIERMERRVIDSIVSLGRSHGLKARSYEHDGITGPERWSSLIGPIKDQLGVVVSIKPVPKDYEELEVLLQGVFGQDYRLDLPELTPDRVQELLEDPLHRALYSLEAGDVDHDAFARVVARELDGTFAIEREDKENLTVQWFDKARKIWVRAGGARRLWCETTSILRRVAKPRNADGEYEPAPGKYGNKHFVSSVVDMLKCHLPAATELEDLDGDTARFLLRFSCGKVLDFRTGEVRPARPEDRISQCTGKPFRPFKDEGIEQLLLEINNFWAQGGTDVGFFFAQRLDKLVGESKLYGLFYGLTEDHNLALWLLKQCARAIAGVPGVEEVLWMSDSRGSNGKGCVLALLKHALGIKNGYYGTLTYEKHFLGTGQARWGNDPDLAACEGKRVIVVNEGPDLKDSRQPLNVALIKRLTCGSDDPISSTAKYKDPSFWQPQCLLAFATNFTPSFPTEDGGVKSRLSYVYMPFSFVQNPKPDSMERKLDTSIKTDLVPKLVPELMYWAVFLVQGIMMQRSSRVLLPRPPKVVEDSDIHFLSAPSSLEAQRRGKEYIEGFLVPWEREMGRPATRTEIQKHFKETHEHADIRASLQGYLREAEGRTRFSQRFQGQSYTVYKARLQGGKVSDSETVPLVVVTIRDFKPHAGAEEPSAEQDS